MYREVAPDPRLRSLVASVWAFPTNEHVHRVLPDGCMDIVFLDGRANLVGSMRTAISIPPQSTAALGIRLRPGEADRLFPGIAGELTDTEAPLTELWGDDGKWLEEALLGIIGRASVARHDADEILRAAQPIVEAAIAARLAAHRGAVDVRTRAAASLLADGQSVASVAEQVNLSERQLARRFHERVGLSPKTFARVRRLQRAAILLKSGSPLSSAAAAAGYSDQPHFTREASDLAGITPVGLASELTDGNDTIVPVVL